MHEMTKERFVWCMQVMREAFLYCSKAVDWDNVINAMQEIGEQVTRITGMNPDEAAKLIVRKMLVDDDELSLFLETSMLPSASESICKQMQTDSRKRSETCKPECCC